MNETQLPVKGSLLRNGSWSCLMLQQLLTAGFFFGGLT